MIEVEATITASREDDAGGRVIESIRLDRVSVTAVCPQCGWPAAGAIETHREWFIRWWQRRHNEKSSRLK